MSRVLSLLLGRLLLPWIWLCLWRPLTKEDLSKSSWVNISVPYPTSLHAPSPQPPRKERKRESEKGKEKIRPPLNNSKKSLNNPAVITKTTTESPGFNGGDLKGTHFQTVLRIRKMRSIKGSDGSKCERWYFPVECFGQYKVTFCFLARAWFLACILICLSRMCHIPAYQRTCVSS